MTHIGSCISARGVQPIIPFQHKFKSTYLYGAYSPINGDSFIWEINGVDGVIFEAYLKAFSNQRPNEFKIVVIDNAPFHSTKNIEVPENIYLLRIPPYCPELNPCEQIWKYIKERFKIQRFEDLTQLKNWLYDKVNQMTKLTIKSITSNHHYLNDFNVTFHS